MKKVFFVKHAGLLSLFLFPMLSQPDVLRENKTFDTARTHAGNVEMMSVADASTGIHVDTAVQVDEINAYSYVYPVGVAQQNIRWYILSLEMIKVSVMESICVFAFLEDLSGRKECFEQKVWNEI